MLPDPAHAADPMPPADAAAAIDQARRRADAGALLTLAQEVEDTALAEFARQSAREALSRRGWDAAAQDTVLAVAARTAEPAPADSLPALPEGGLQPTGFAPGSGAPSSSPGDAAHCRVWLFSGHLMDAPGRPAPRFPPALEDAAAAAIGQALDDLGARPGDTLYSQAAAGGDLLCLEAALARGMAAEVLLPHDEAVFVERSMLVSSHGPDWQRRWQVLRPRLAAPPRSLTTLGPAARNPYERANRWLLNTALATGGPRGVQVLALWDGIPAGAEGGTWQVVAAAQRLHWPLRIVYTRVLAGGD